MASTPKKFYRQKRWQALGALIVSGVTALLLSRELKPLVEWAGRRAGVGVSVDSARLGWGGARVKNLSVAQRGAAAPFARVGFLEVDWRCLELARGRIARVNIQSPSLSLRGLEEFQNSRAKPDTQPKKSAGGGGFFHPVIGTLIVRDGTLTLDNLGAGLPAISIDLASVDPLVVNNLRLGAGGDDAGSREEQTITVENLVINSPYDPLTAIMKFEQIALTFSWAGIQKQRITELRVKNPTVYIGHDLFYLADQVQAAGKSASAGQKTPGTSPSAAAWSIGHFHLWGGRLVVYSFGRPGFPLPMIFMAESHDMALNNFANLPFNKLGFDIPSTDLAYETIGLKVINLSGALFVGLPPRDEGAKNLVPVLQIEELDWRGVVARDLYVSMTFDRANALAIFGGRAEQGYVNGGVHVNLGDFEWTGWASASKVALGGLTRMLSPENFIMDGKATGTVIARGQASVVSGVGGTLTLNGAGKIQIVSVEEALKKLPGDWWQPKREAVKALLEAFERYDYAGGEAEFTYAPPESFLRLSVDGQRGKRSFDLRWHDLREKPGLGF
ncbi:MAG: hypothetical protein LBD30_05450 [Verrucomicrobiales bacterium]|jgi:hypothetical protein|nr:hypothetical protein [Verrucomicrobiales bacterium]